MDHSILTSRSFQRDVRIEWLIFLRDFAKTTMVFPHGCPFQIDHFAMRNDRFEKADKRLQYIRAERLFDKGNQKLNKKGEPPVPETPLLFDIYLIIY